ncbi:MAG: M23 family metallopeptidase [Proteobacteria bacterium]|nr:M23 family metallopeptidase [Pseudomonadota bacterium]
MRRSIWSPWSRVRSRPSCAARDRGGTVKCGQTIARIGSSGNVSRPQLHFEIRKGTRAVNPTGLLGPQRAAAG